MSLLGFTEKFMIASLVVVYIAIAALTGVLFYKIFEYLI